MSKKKEPKKLSHPSSDENNLTPWQKANRKYLAEQGMKNQEPKKEDTPLDVSEWIKAIGKISSSAQQPVVQEIESAVASFIKLETLNDQYDKIDKSIDKDPSEANKGVLKFNINKAKNLSDDDKANLLAYIDLK